MKQILKENRQGGSGNRSKSEKNSSGEKRTKTANAKKRIISFITVAAMAIGTFAVAPIAEGPAHAAGTVNYPVVINMSTVSANGTGFTYTQDTSTLSAITITENGYYKITGSTDSKRVMVNGVTAYITLENTTIDRSAVGVYSPPINAGCALELAGSETYLTLEGNNTLKSGQARAALQVTSGSKLTIDALSGGKLTAVGKGTWGGAGIGGGAATGERDAGYITINSGIIIATGGGNSAGIGGGYGGGAENITINGGTISAAGGEHGAGIGSNGEAKVKNITINGGTISAAGGEQGAGIGGNFDSDGKIVINGGTINALGGSQGAGIGSNYFCTNGAIIIKAGDITATGGVGAAGIGGGIGSSGGTITISGGKIKATGGNGYTWDSSSMTGPGGGAGIGGGASMVSVDDAPGYFMGNAGNITITGDAEVWATGGSSEVKGSGGGAGIGGGGGDGTFGSDIVGGGGDGGTINIAPDAKVTASGGTGPSGDGADIGAGGGKGKSGDAKMFKLTVVFGSGSGIYPVGFNAPILANEKPSYTVSGSDIHTKGSDTSISAYKIYLRFEMWESTNGTVAEPRKLSTTFTTTEGAATVTAIYRPDDICDIPGPDNSPNYKGDNKGRPILQIPPSAENPLDLSRISPKALTIADKTWTGKQIKSGLTVKLSYILSGKVVTKTLKQNTDYTIGKAGKNKNIGKGTITITGKAGSVYKGTKTLNFKIIPKKPTGLKLKAGKKSLKISFKKVSKAQKIKTYKVQYKLKSAKKWKSKTVRVKLTGKAGKKKTVTLTLKRLKSKKTYQVRVYAYKGSYKGLPTGTKSKKVK